MKKRNLIIITLIFSALFIIGAKGKSEEMATMTAADSSDGVMVGDLLFKWEFTANDLIIELKAPTTGWIAIGFAPTMMMKNSDIYIGSVEDGEGLIEDHFGTGNVSHKKDSSLGGMDNTTLLASSETNGETMLRFSIPLSGSDKWDKPPQEGEKIKVISAWGSSDNLGKRHKGRASKIIQF